MSLGNTVGTHLNLWNTLGTHLEYTWNTFGIHLEYTWNTLGIHLEHTFLETFLFFLDLGLRWPGWTGNTVGIQVWITGRISGFEEHTWDISFWENGCLSISEGHTHRTWAGKEPFWNTLRSTFWAYKQHTFGTQKIILDISNVWLLWVVVMVQLIAWAEDTYIGLTLRLFLVSWTLRSLFSPSDENTARNSWRRV